MDIRAYFQKVRQTEQSISAPWVVVISQETSDGGKAGQANEVSRDVAAQLIVEGRAKLASESEAREYRDDLERLRTAAEQERSAGKVQIALLSEENIRALKTGLKPKG